MQCTFRLPFYIMQVSNNLVPTQEGETKRASGIHCMYVILITSTFYYLKFLGSLPNIICTYIIHFGSYIWTHTCNRYLMGDADAESTLDSDIMSIAPRSH